MQPPAAPACCENCATEEDDLTSVWPSADPSAESPQLWCPECVATYPHEPAGDDGEDDEVAEQD